MTTISIGNVKMGNGNPFVLIAGPCQIENKDHALMVASRIADMCDIRGIGFIYKSSFDKANRTSHDSPRGVGLSRGLDILQEVRMQVGCPVITDVHETWQVEEVAKVADVIQIPALLARQTDLIVEAARTGKAINIKKGQYMAPHNMIPAILKAKHAGNERVMVTERGTMLGYGNLVVDYRSLTIMRDTGYPVIFDATHSVQAPSSFGNASGGDRRFITPLARAAVAVGVAGIFIETHEDPDNAPSDGPCMLDLGDLGPLLSSLQAIERGLRNLPYAE